jgi:hypothetical protein
MSAPNGAPKQKDVRNTNTAIQEYQLPEEQEIQRMRRETLRLNNTSELCEAVDALKGMTQEEAVEMMQEETARINNEIAQLYSATADILRKTDMIKGLHKLKQERDARRANDSKKDTKKDKGNKK